VAAKRLMLDIARCVRRTRASSGDIDPEKIAEILERALAPHARYRRNLLLGLAEYLGTAAEGTALDPETWRPLEHFPHLRD
jgi:hypothetical protein